MLSVLLADHNQPCVITFSRSCDITTHRHHLNVPLSLLPTHHYTLSQIHHYTPLHHSQHITTPPFPPHHTTPSHHHTMACEPGSYVSGVPVRISETFRPPRKVTLPASCPYTVDGNLLTEEVGVRLG